MKKSLQYVITFSCLLIAGSITYYFVSYIPEKNTQALQKDCYKMAMDRSQEDKKISLPENAIPTEPQYTFDGSTKTCLYKTMYLSTVTSKEGVDLYSTYSSIDLQRNVEVAGYSSASKKDGETVLTGNKTDFEKLDKRLFSK
jgi:hypothetical protein